MDLTIICSAWSKQKDFDLLVKQHFELSQKASPNIDVIYAFDSDHKYLIDHENFKYVITNKPTTTAQSFNMALALVQTKFVCVLNLDDFYFGGALPVLIKEMEKSNASIGCGDWVIDYSLFVADGDRKFSLEPLNFELFQVCKNWPPEKEKNLRLGSGDGGRGTLGPAPVFLTKGLRSVGGYPHTFSDGSPIKTIIDYIVWDKICERGEHFVRVNIISGSYYSNPQEQQEFRNENAINTVEKEHELYLNLGI